MNRKLFGKALFEECGKYVSCSDNKNDNGSRYCVWCGNDINNRRRRRYCNDACKEQFQKEYNERYNWEFIREKVIRVRGRYCHHCGTKGNIENLIPLCHECHRKETNKLITRDPGSRSRKILSFLL